MSLHAPNDELRNRLVPVNRKIGLNAVLLAADRYFEVSGRRLTFEYVLLSEINDRAEHARELACLLRGRAALLNVIPYNPVGGLGYQTPSLAAQERFRKILEGAGVNVQFRHARDRISTPPAASSVEAGSRRQKKWRQKWDALWRC